ncbi:MAG: hypothetical protein M1839_004653 [Geoglossum umbratile]|nr:MAG: hypothetical protein M1839_004653 [Geoglossum umbratile]
MDNLTLVQSIHFVSAILVQGRDDDFLPCLERNENVLRSLAERGDNFWQRLSEDTIFPGHSPEALRAQANFFFEKLQGLLTDEALPLPAPSTASFTRQQHCFLFCEVYDVPFSKLPPLPISCNIMAELLQKSSQFPGDMSSERIVNIYTKLEGFLGIFLVRVSTPLFIKAVLRELKIFPMPPRGLEIMRTVYQMCCSGDFYNTEEMTRWERAAEKLSNPHPERPVALEVECTYNNYLAMHKYDYQEDEVRGIEEADDLTFEKIGLVIAAKFGDEESLSYLLTRESRAWYPAFHRTDKYWKRLSQNTILRNRSWRSVKGQTISLLSEIGRSGGRIPHFNKYEITPLLDFTYEQNMFLIEKALKLETLIPFTQRVPRDMVDMLSESWVFDGYIPPNELPMLCFQIRRLVSCLEPSLRPDELEMVDETRQLQVKTGLDPSEKSFWETVKYLQKISKLRKNYNKVIALYRGDVQARGDEEHGDEEHGDEEHDDEEHGDEEHDDEEHGDEEQVESWQGNSMSKQPGSTTETKLDQLLVR